jgi:DNA-binding transcriptional ArsR family regulator
LSKFGVLFAVLTAFAILSTVLLGFNVAGVKPFTLPPPNQNSTVGPPNPGPVPQGQLPSVSVPLNLLQSNSPYLAPVSWFAVAGAWIWRGRTRSRWVKLGLSRDTFNLLVKMKGSRTRVGMIRALTVPKDRYQLANELGLDWTTVDYHIKVLLENGLVHEQTAYGNVKMYELTPIGSTLLKVLDETDSGRLSNS